jgi:hypothetical protein
MRRLLLLTGIVAAVLVTAAAVFAVFTLPPRAARAAATPADARLIWGAYHVHSNVSDGSGTQDEIARAAARAGLHFVVFTDHGDGTRLEPPQYRHGVLCLDAPEIATEAGHLVALNLQQPSAYPLAGEARDVIDDIHRLGGWAVAAHPDSPSAGLRWRQTGARIDGFEWLNIDSEWRAHGTSRLLATGLRALIRAPESIGSLLDDDERAFTRWDGGQTSRGVFSVAALDAHARIGADDEGGARRWAIRFPGYDALFRTVAQVARLGAPLSGDAAADGRLILQALGAGQSYSVVRAYVDGLPAIEFVARSGGNVTALSGRAQPTDGALSVEARSPAVADAQLTILRDGQAVASGRGSARFDAGSTPGRFRLRAHVPGHQFPWLVSNAIDVGTTAVATLPADKIPDRRGNPLAPEAWQIEKDAGSAAILERTEDTIELRFQLRGGGADGQYVALSAPAGTDPIEGIAFTVRSARPMRVSVQVRAPGGRDGQRWRKSIYSDEQPRRVEVRLAELNPVDRRSSLRPVVAKLQSLLMVVDTVNARPGTSGSLMLSDVTLLPPSSPVPSPPRAGSTSGR